MIVWINKIYLRIHSNLIIYVIVTDFLIIQYIYIKHKMCKNNLYIQCSFRARRES